MTQPPDTIPRSLHDIWYAGYEAGTAEIAQAFAVLRGTLVPFNERTQEFFCKVCRYRDPLGPDGNKLHDDHCPFLAVLDLLEAPGAGKGQNKEHL